MNHILLYYLISIPIALIIILIIDRITCQWWDDSFVFLMAVGWPMTILCVIITAIISLLRLIIDFFCDLK